jgi:hypothetical protein
MDFRGVSILLISPGNIHPLSRISGETSKDTPEAFRANLGVRLTSFSQRGMLEKIYLSRKTDENVQKRWSSYGLPFGILAIGAFEPD